MRNIFDILQREADSIGGFNYKKDPLISVTEPTKITILARSPGGFITKATVTEKVIKSGVVYDTTYYLEHSEDHNQTQDLLKQLLTSKQLYTEEEMKSAYNHGAGNAQANEAGLEGLEPFEDWLRYHNLIHHNTTGEKPYKK